MLISSFEIFQALAMVLFNPDMLGEKKYSPPLGMMKTPIEMEVNGLRGSSPIMLLVPWPISGSRLSRWPLLWIKQIDKQILSRTLEALC